MKLKYVCIHCNLHSKRLPPILKNECISAYTHEFVKIKNIIPDNKRPKFKEEQ